MKRQLCILRDRGAFKAMSDINRHLCRLLKTGPMGAMTDDINIQYWQQP